MTVALIASACGGDADSVASDPAAKASAVVDETPDDTEDEEGEGQDVGADGAEAEPDTAGATSEEAGLEDTPEDGGTPEDEGAQSSAVEYPITVVDAIGVEHTIDGPVRLGCVAKICTEILAGLGMAPAASTYREGEPFFYPLGPPEFVVTNNNDIEAWAGAELDFAVFGGPKISFHETVEDVVPLFFLHTAGRTAPDLTGYEAIYESTRAIAQLVDRVAEGEQLIADLETAIATARTFSTPELADRTFVNLFNGEAYLLEIGNADEVGSWAFCSVILAAELGVCAEVDIAAQEVSAEAFLELDPDIVAMQAGALTVETRDDPVWGRISAVQNGLAYDSVNNGYRFSNIRSLIWSLQEYVHFTVPDAGIPHPGLLAEFVPEDSPLVS
ncbi:MAG: ABC transporter substrate-binding protein [Actinomycetota bacterium]